jgi:hypothetical protein
MSMRITALLVLLSGLRTPQSEPGPTTVWKSEAPLVMVGVLDEPAWQRTERVRVDYIHGKTGQLSDGHHMDVRYTWDENYFYIGYETFDRNVVALGTGKKEGPEKNPREGCEISHPKEPVDVVEFFISSATTAPGRSTTTLRTSSTTSGASYDDSWPISKSSIDRYGIHFGFSEFIRDDEEAGHTFARPRSWPPSTLNDSRTRIRGTSARSGFPAGLGAPRDRETFDAKRHRGPWKMEGQQMLVLAVVQDGDLKDRYHHSSPTLPGGWFHKGAAHYPRLDLATSKK